MTHATVDQALRFDALLIAMMGEDDDLRAEFAAWDELSDEALVEFERCLEAEEER